MNRFKSYNLGPVLSLALVGSMAAACAPIESNSPGQAAMPTPQDVASASISDCVQHELDSGRAGAAAQEQMRENAVLLVGRRPEVIEDLRVILTARWAQDVCNKAFGQAMQARRQRSFQPVTPY